MLRSVLEPSTHNTGLERYRPVNLPSTTAYVCEMVYISVSQVPGPGINYTGPREVLVEFVILSFLSIFHE